MSGKTALRITPQSLSLPEGNNLVVLPMQLENLTEQCVTFRIKVTAPDRYSVRPSSGLLMEGESLEVQVVKNTSPASNSDKFLILSQTVRAEDAAAPLAQLWADPPPERVQKQVIRAQVAGAHPVSTSTLSTGPTQDSVLYQSITHSNVAEQLKKQNEDFCSKVQHLNQQNKHLKEQKQKQQARLQTLQQEITSAQAALNQSIARTKPKSASLLGVQGKAILALGGFITGYALGCLL